MGQPGLCKSDCIVSCGGQGLTEMTEDECEAALAELFGDQVEVVVEGFVELLAYFPPFPSDINDAKADLNQFSQDYAVKAEFVSDTEMKISGCQTAVKVAK